MGTGHCKGVRNSILVFGSKWPSRCSPLATRSPGTKPFYRSLGSHINYSVNLGGWLVTEPFIVPALYQKYSNMTYGNGSFEITDEWKLVTQMRADGSIGDLENHYDTFIVSSFTKFTFSFSSSHHSQTEQDFAQIVGAGLNWIRLPIPFWAIETVGDEPYLESVQWKCSSVLFTLPASHNQRLDYRRSQGHWLGS
jgi:glucan 1,3-beta-glucosidase